MTAPQDNEFGPWQLHDGKGMPCLPSEIAHTVDVSGDEIISRADDPLNVCEAGSSWEWGADDFGSYSIIRYRIKKPRALLDLIQLIADLPAPVAPIKTDGVIA